MEQIFPGMVSDIPKPNSHHELYKILLHWRENLDNFYQVINLMLQAKHKRFWKGENSSIFRHFLDRKWSRKSAFLASAETFKRLWKTFFLCISCSTISETFFMHSKLKNDWLFLLLFIFKLFSRFGLMEFSWSL